MRPVKVVGWSATQRVGERLRRRARLRAIPGAPSVDRASTSPTKLCARFVSTTRRRRSSTRWPTPTWRNDTASCRCCGSCSARRRSSGRSARRSGGRWRTSSATLRILGHQAGHDRDGRHAGPLLDGRRASATRRWRGRRPTGTPTSPRPGSSAGGTLGRWNIAHVARRALVAGPPCGCRDLRSDLLPKPLPGDVRRRSSMRWRSGWCSARSQACTAPPCSTFLGKSASDPLDAGRRGRDLAPAVPGRAHPRLALPRDPVTWR